MRVSVVKAAFIRDLGYGMRGIYQHAASVRQPYFVQIIDKGIVRAFLIKQLNETSVIFARRATSVRLICLS